MSMIVPYANELPRLPPHGSFGRPFYSNPHLSPSPQCLENQQKIQSDDFLSFLEDKAKPKSELNPFATEFSLTKTSPEPSIGSSPTEDSLSYRLIFNDLVEKSLQSIEVITKAAKIHSVQHASVQCESTVDHIHRSTQTKDESEKQHLLDEYSAHSIRLIDRLSEIFKTVLPMSSAPEVLHEYQSMSQTCAELRHSILLIHQMGSPIGLINASSATMKDPFLPSSSSSSSAMMMFDSGGRGRRLISSSINDCPIPSFSSRQIDAITKVRSKCRTLSSPPDGKDNT